MWTVQRHMKQWNILVNLHMNQSSSVQILQGGVYILEAYGEIIANESSEIFLEINSQVLF